MLYLNVYIVSRAYGGPEEGGWWYDVGEVIAAVPIPTKHERGQDYYMNGNRAVVHQCRDCNGTGELGCSDEECNCQEEGRGYEHMERCDCGEVPADCEALAKLHDQYRDMLQDEVGRREELRIMVQKHFGTNFPSHRPHYE